MDVPRLVYLVCLYGLTHKQEFLGMKSLAALLFGLLLTVGMVGCAKEEPAATPAPAASDAAPAGDADADGDANATDAAPADPAAN